MWCEKVISYLIETTIKSIHPFISLEIAIKRLSISTHLKKQKNWKAKSKVQDAAKIIPCESNC
jgi:hypothetical protein